ncbi:hypothetical protein QQ045_013784 [Rhodiola kirilowii]
MDVKGITWFGNVYQKFETMCLEVEEAVCQDTVKYVENQVQTVGASVKKFYSEVVDDLLSPTLMDPVKVNSLPCTGVHKKPKLGIKEEPKKQSFEDRNATTKVDKNSTYASIDRFSNSDPAVPCNTMSSSDVISSNYAIGRKRMGATSKKTNLVIKRKPKNLIPNSSEVSKATNSAAINPINEAVPSGALTIEKNEAPTGQVFEQQLDPDAVSQDSTEMGVKITGDENQESFELEQISDTSMKPATVFLSDGLVACHTKESVVGRSLKLEEGSKPVYHTEASDSLTNILPSDASSGSNDADARNKDATGFGYSYAEEWTTQTGETDGWNIETISSDDDDDVEEGTEIVDVNFNKHVLLEESCIMVDRDNLPFDSHKEPKQHKSYKKKLKDAFSSRGKSVRKKEYRQLAAQFPSTTDTELEQHIASSSTRNSEQKNLKSAQLCESEWEIL